MTKELEALERIKKSPEIYWKLNGKHHYLQDLDIIETALKDYEYQTKVFEKLTESKLPILTEEEIEQLKKSSGYIAEYNGTYVDENTFKKLKVLDIIKEHGLIIDDLLSCLKEEDAYWDYHWQFENLTQDLTQEEYELLREILL